MNRIDKFLTHFESLPIDDDKKPMHYHILILFEELDSLEKLYKTNQNEINVEDIISFINYILVYLDFSYGSKHSLFIYYKLKCCKYYLHLGYKPIFWKHFNNCFFSFSSIMNEKAGSNTGGNEEEDKKTLVMFINLFFQLNEQKHISKCLFDFWTYDKNNFSYQYYCSKYSFLRGDFESSQNFVMKSEEFIKTEKQREKYHLLFSDILIKQKKIEECEKQLLLALEVRNHVKILIKLGMFYYSIKPEIHKCLDYFKASLRKRFDFVTFERYVLIQIEKKINHLECIDHLKILIEKQRNRSQLVMYHIYLGDCCLQVADESKNQYKEEARINFGIALRLLESTKNKSADDKRKLTELKRRIRFFDD